MTTMAEQLDELSLLAGEDARIVAALERLRAYKPDPESKTWEEDARMRGYWMGRCLAVWDAIPVEFRGPITEPRTLVEKVELMTAEIARLRAALAVKP